MMTPARKPRTSLVLLVCPGLERLSALQEAFASGGFEVIVARDLPTALLAISQHDLGACLISARITESGDGYVLGSVFRRIFPKAFVAVLTAEAGVPELQAAINHGMDQLFDDSIPAAEIVSQLRTRVLGDVVAPPSRKVQ
jgi:DNA-binding NtrC family response regulator